MSVPFHLLDRPITEYIGVKLWLEEYGQFWGIPPSMIDQELSSSLLILERFCAFVGKDPDQIAGECLRPSKVGEGVMLRTKARREYIGLIADFERKEGSRASGSAVRSFFIHNGVAMTPSALR
ncbi:MAG: hypothetical protein HS107_04330 [Thermoflexaceae bacterium]|nr:hypothetical protein [Thermoflexaceae bacterium]